MPRTPKAKNSDERSVRIMKYVQFASDMQALDRHTIRELAVPSAVLMERAALAVADAAEELLFRAEGPFAKRLVVAVCGTGNNGGDGAAAARILQNRGIRAEAVVIGDPGKLSPDLSMELRLAENFGVPVRFGSMQIAEDAAVYIDALFGIGLCREVGGDFAEAVRKMNEAPGAVVAADIPSGISADTGQVLGAAVRAAITVSMQCGKPGLFLDPGRQYAGEVRIADIGIFVGSPRLADPKGNADAREEETAVAAETAGGFRPPIVVLEKEDLPALLPKRVVSGNKGTFGKVVLIAGSRNMAGAAILAARAVLASGAGMVKVVTASCNREILQTAVPEALLAVYDADNASEVLKDSLGFGNVLAAGPGLGTGPEAADLLRTLLSELPNLTGKPRLVLDADALNLLSADGELAARLPAGTFLTPHIAEMARLLHLPAERVVEDRLRRAAAFAEEKNVRVLLKDARTVIAADGRLFINPSGTDGMATAGSGDVLTGILAGLLAQQAPAACAGPAAAFLHGLAGEKAAEALGRRSMTAADICRFMPEACREIFGDDF